MEHFHFLLDEAKKKHHVADHMLTQTYPLLKDPKLLLSVVSNLSAASINAMLAVLEYERLYKRVPPYSENFEQKYFLFRDTIAKKYNIPLDGVLLIKDLKSMLEEHKKSPVEFSRKDQYVICSSSYRMRTVDVPKMKSYINAINLLIDKCSKIVNKI